MKCTRATVSSGEQGTASALEVTLTVDAAEESIIFKVSAIVVSVPLRCYIR